MESSPNDTSADIHIPSNQRQTLEVEYKTAFEMFQMQNSQAWQTFNIVSTLALAGLAFVGQLKATGGQAAWSASVAIGLGMITILIGWLMLARRWWAFAQAQLHRMREIEKLLGMYLIREGTWLREPLDKAGRAELNGEEIAKYNSVHSAFPGFPAYRGRQEVLSSIIVGALILIWGFCMLTEIAPLI
jgi:hypothetical protein